MKENVLEGAMVGEKNPEHLSKHAKDFWRWALYEYQLNRDELQLLLMACEAMDRCIQARKRLAKQGLTYNDRFGQPKSRPEVAIERDSRLAFARLVKQLGLGKKLGREMTTENPWNRLVGTLGTG